MVLTSLALALGLAALGGATAADPQPAAKEIAFTGKVTALVMLMDYRGQAILTHADPRFALSVEVEQATPADKALETGKVTTFAIHSPALLFGGVGMTDANQIVGQRFEFSIEKNEEPGRCRWNGLAVERHLPAR